MQELTPEQIVVLERLRDHGFTLVAFPLYATKIGIRKGDCAALLDPAGGGMSVFGDPCYLVGGNLSVLVGKGTERFFIWKKSRLPATPERLAELERFARELSEFLAGAV